MIRNLNSASTGSTGAPSTEKINASSNTSSLNDLERLERGSASDNSSVDNFMKEGSNTKLSTDELSLALPLSNLSRSFSDDVLLLAFIFSVEGAPVEPVEAEFKFLIIFFSDGILQTCEGELKPGVVDELFELLFIVLLAKNV
jgi:hypothetical protein